MKAVKQFIFFLSGFSLLLTVGCASGSIFQEAKNTNPEEDVVVYIYRPANILHNGVNAKVTVNYDLLGPLKKGGYVSTQVPAGKIHVYISGGMLMRIASDVLHVKIEAEPDSKLFFKLSANNKLHWYSEENIMSLDQIPEAVAMEEISTMKKSD